MPDTPAADARLIELLWAAAPPTQGGRLTTARIVGAGLDLADADGLEALSMRHVAGRLGVAPMSLYTHVPDKRALLVLMADAAMLRMPVTEPSFGAGWRERLRLVAADNRALLLRHPWLLELPPARPPLGPGLLAKYEWELSAFRGLGLSPLELDSCLSTLLRFVRGAAADELAARRDAAARAAAGDDWWEEVGAALDRHVREEDFPLATRIGAQASAALAGRDAADHALDFGLDRLLDGIAALIRR